MRFLIGIIFVFFIHNSLHTQVLYLDEITDSICISTYTYIQKEGQNLDMDVYTPNYDNVKDRPVILYVHGGGFYTGIRNDEGALEFCKKIASRGYVAVSISYRLLRKGTKTLLGCDCPVKDKQMALGAVIDDLQDAVRFLVMNKSDFEIDTNNIILCGSSAGAETVLSAVYNPFLYDVSSSPVKYSGVISLAGAIADTSCITKDMAIPSMLFHGSSDNIVPYGTAPHHYCSENSSGYLILNGSESISKKLKELGTPYWFYTINGKDHCVSWTPMSKQFNEIMQFCYDFVLTHDQKQISTNILKE